MNKQALDADVDVVVIGGGVNGTGVARDLSMRGIRVALFEKHDLAFGASGNSSGMIHGGVRYLSTHPEVTKSSCQDSGYIQQIAPHLLFRIPFLMPIASGPRSQRLLLTLVDAFFRAYDDFQPLKRGKPHTRLNADELKIVEPSLVGDFIGAVTFDEWGIDGARLCTLNALDASQRGAQIHVHTQVTRVEKKSSSQAFEVHWRNTLTRAVGVIRASFVVNATGAWGPITGAMANVPIKVRPGKGIHVVYDRRLTNYAIVAKAIDGRQVFLEPWENMSVLGTTDDDYYGDLDDVTPTADEVRYLVQAIAKIFPAIRQARAIGMHTGVRPSLYEYGVLEDKISREHAIVDHSQTHVGAMPGLYSMIGGKLASYRVFAEEMSDRLAQKLHNSEPCRTHLNTLPGGDSTPSAFELASLSPIDPLAARRLMYRHGSRVHLITERIARAPQEARIVCVCEPVLEAEVRHVIHHEFASTVDDVSRRTRLGLGACGGMRCALRCGQIVAQETGITQTQGQQQAIQFLTRQRTYRAPALGPAQARQEALMFEHLNAQLKGQLRNF